MHRLRDFWLVVVLVLLVLGLLWALFFAKLSFDWFD